MDRLLIVEWLAAEAVVMYRGAVKLHYAPMPGQLLATSGVFVLLALLAEGGPNAARLAGLLGGGFLAAAALNLFPAVSGSPVPQENMKAPAEKAPVAKKAAA